MTPRLKAHTTRRLVAWILTLPFSVAGAQEPTSHTVALFPSASDASRQGFARVINHSAQDGEIRIAAVDDSGYGPEPVTLAIRGSQTAHFNSDDLEYGNELKGLSGGVGSGQGDWRLALTSDLDLEVLAYIRTDGGFLTAMHDVVPATGNRHHVAIFNPGSNDRQVSRLRIVNPGEDQAAVTIAGVDSVGAMPGKDVGATIPAGAARTFTAQELESSGLGDGTAKWRLTVDSDRPVIVQSLLESPNANLTNLSTTVDTRRVPLFLAASSPLGQGFVQIRNRSADGGEMTVRAFDDAGVAREPVTLTIGGGETRFFNSDDLEQGNPDKEGLSVGIGAGEGDWRLEFASTLDIEVLAYVRTEDGFLTAIHDTAPGTGYYARLPTFNPASNPNQVSRLRLVNHGTATADVRIQGIDDDGKWSRNVRASIPAGAALGFSAQQLESGDEGLAGALGDGAGKWQLIVRADQPVTAMSLMESRARHLTSLSTVPFDRSDRAFDHSQAFAKLPVLYNLGDSESLWERTWYRSNYHHAKYAGYDYLLRKHGHHLPSGRGLTILQAESAHTPEDLGSVLHLFDYETHERHARLVAELLTELANYYALYSSYTTYSHQLDNFHAADTADLREFIGDAKNVERYPLTSYDDVAIAPAKLLNVSNTNGGSSGQLVRQFDKLIEENDMVACTAMSSLSSGNWTTSGMSYNSIVVDQFYANPSNYDGAKINDHGSPRDKPDISARSSAGTATSYSAPQVCSAAAVLLERAKVDPRLANAYNSVAVKSILMAGATRFDYKISVGWSDASPAEPLFYDGGWERTSDTRPLSRKYGAGALNVLAAYDILDAGEFDTGDPVGPRGWDYARDLAQGDVSSYRFNVDDESMFSAVLVWHRYIDDAWNSYLPDYELAVYDESDVLVAYSNDVTSNVELVEFELQPGSYEMKVRLISDGGSPEPLSYGLAWTTKTVCADPGDLRVVRNGDDWDLDWAIPAAEQCRKYRLEARAGSDDAEEVSEEVYLDVNSYTYAIPDDSSARYFRVYAYPQDKDVAYHYPSSPIRAVGEASSI